MLVAIAITLSLDVIGNGVLILIGILIGTAVGVVASHRVQMTEMPQMVALYNGVGGGAAALISWSEFRHARRGGASIPLDILVPILFSTVIGSVSFWGSNIAFGKLQAIIPSRPIQFPGQHIVNGLLLAAILAGCIVLGIDHDSPVAGPLHRRPDRRGGAGQPLRAADRRRRHAGGDLAAQRLHRVSRRPRRDSRWTTSS